MASRLASLALDEAAYDRWEFRRTRGPDAESNGLASEQYFADGVEVLGVGVNLAALG